MIMIVFLSRTVEAAEHGGPASANIGNMWENLHNKTCEQIEQTNNISELHVLGHRLEVPQKFISGWWLTYPSEKY